MFKKKFFLVFLFMFLSALCFSQQIDPATGNKTGYHISPVFMESNYTLESSFRDSIPPSFIITHIENGEITIQVISDEELFTGWVDEKLIWSAANFDYWWLNTRLAKDMQNNIYAGIKLYEYSSPNSNFDMYELYNNGNIFEEHLDWNGPGGNPLLVNNPEENVYLGQPTLDPEGVVDIDNITYIASNAGGSNVLFTKIDADGTILVNNQTVITGANAWTNEIRIALDTNNRIYLVWSASMHDITLAYSDDSGDSWSTPVSLCYNASQQLNKPQICCDNNDNVHIIWQHWTGSSNLLAYMKLNPDCTISIDESFLTQANNQVWSAKMDIDEENNLHIVWAKSSQQITSAYYTKINGNLDGNGLPMTDAELSIVQEHSYLINQNIRYPKCVVDNYQNVHSIYEQGNYGCNENKSVYYKKMNSVPLLRIECPNDSVLFVEMTGSGISWEGTFTPPELGIYNVRVSASDIDGNTGVDFYQFEYTGPSTNGFISGNVFLEGGIGNVEEVIVTAGIEYTNPDLNGDYLIEIPAGTYDVTATLDDYIPFNDSVTVVSGQTTIVNIVLYCWDQIAPPENLTYIIAGDYLTWDPPQTALNWFAYNVYIDNTLIASIPDTTTIIFNPSPGSYNLTAVYEYGESFPSNTVIVPVTGTDDDILCFKTELLGNYPNPFNPTTTIFFNLTTEHTSLRQGYAGQAESTELMIYNLKGQIIRTFQIPQSEIINPNSVVWNGTDDNNIPVSSGIYFYKLKAGIFEKTNKMILMK